MATYSKRHNQVILTGWDGKFIKGHFIDNPTVMLFHPSEIMADHGWSEITQIIGERRKQNPHAYTTCPACGATTPDPRPHTE